MYSLLGKGVRIDKGIIEISPSAFLNSDRKQNDNPHEHGGVSPIKSFLFTLHSEPP